jgi:glycosyltransferase involved in cell wall biosynthesis
MAATPMTVAAHASSGPSPQPLLAVCLATCEAPMDLLSRQVESIQAQTHERFVCIVSDDASSPDAFAAVERIRDGDERFTVTRSPQRLGFYRNFERALSLVPPEAQYVAFSDQDDVWRPEKLETLLSELDNPAVQLAYSDMRIVDEAGHLLAPSYWTDRRNNWTSLASLLLTNTITGAASLFRRTLLDDALPFPPHSFQYHDHWIACLALALGEISFVDRPLHDYVQHAENVVGRHDPLPDDYKGGLVNALRRLAADPRRRLRNTAKYAPTYFERDVVRMQLLARTLEERLDGRIAPEKANAVRRVARMSSSPASLAWLLGRSARDVRGESETLGIENQLIKGILWHWQDEARRRVRVRRDG